MFKKIVTTLLLALTFSFVGSIAQAEDNSTTSNAVTSFYGEYVEKEDPKDPPKTPPTPKPTPTPPGNNSGGTGNNGGSNNNGGSGSGNSGYPNGQGGSNNGGSNTPNKVIPQTGNTSQKLTQISGISLLVALMGTVVAIKNKGE